MASKQKKGTGLLQKDEGTVGVMFALLAVPMIALVGTAVDIARTVKARDGLQTAMDSALLAAGNTPAANRVTTATAYFKANTRKIENVKVSFIFDADNNLNGSATAKVSTPFAAISGKKFLTVNVKSKTRPKTTVLVDTLRVPCLHAMDQSGGRTLSIDSNSSFNARTCDVRVRSSSWNGVYETSSNQVQFGMIRVKGGSNITSGYSAAGFSILPEPYRVKDGEAIVSDPYSRFVDAVRSQITVARCTPANTNRTISGTANPGTYCGMTEFKNVTLSPGLYIIASSGSIDGGLKLTGLVNGSAGVSFYFADGKSRFVQYNADQGSNLSAPSSGLTKGLLFFESSNRGGNYTITVSTCKTHSWTGLVYMPGTNIAFDGLEDWPKFNVAVSANQISFKNLSSMTLDPFAWIPEGHSEPVTWPGDPATKTTEAAVLE